MDSESCRWDTRALFTAVWLLFFVSVESSGVESQVKSYPKAENVTWISSGFKAILTWAPEPVDYTYTVEVYRPGKDGEKNEHCIRTVKTSCDLTSVLTDLNATYYAEILSEPKPGDNPDMVEFPYTKSQPFCPYTDTSIAAPHFNITVNQDKSKITLHIQDPITAVYRGGRLLNIRDIFKSDLQYKVIYRKAQSTGKKEKTTNISEVELDVDKGVSYCFNVQAYLLGRRPDKQLGEMSGTHCSPDDGKSLFEEYSIGVIAGGILLVVALVGAVASTVVCCRRRMMRRNGGKEAVPLRDV